MLKNNEVIITFVTDTNFFNYRRKQNIFWFLIRILKLLRNKNLLIEHICQSEANKMYPVANPNWEIEAEMHEEFSEDENDEVDEIHACRK